MSIEQNKREVYFNEYSVLMDKAAYFPFASGLLCGYALTSKTLRSNYNFMPFLFLRDDIKKVIACYNNPSVAAFSVSMWNEQFSLNIAAQVKHLFPKCLIVFGGPQVPYDSKEYFGQNPFIDIVVRGDGEEIFYQILERFLDSSDFSYIPNISWRDPVTGDCVQNETELSKVENLDLHPSPYLEGLFDYLFTSQKDEIHFQAIIETNRGCPFNCAYCFWGKGGLNKKLRYHSINRVAAEIEWCGAHNIKYVFNADSNFGISKRDLDIAQILVKTKKRYGYPEKFRTCFTKDADDIIFEIAMFLYKHRLEKGVTLSFQSMDGSVLRNIKRQNIKLSAYRRLLNKFNKENIPVYTELILGLPGENLRTWKKGIEDIIELGLKGQLFVYPCEVYPNTELDDKDYQRRFGIVTKRILLTETHGSIRQDNVIPEYQDILVTTNSMTLLEWQKMMVFSWAVMLLYSLKLGFFVLLYLFHHLNIEFIDLLEYICEDKMPKVCSILREEIDIYKKHLDQMLKGYGRCMAIPSFGNMYWDMEESSFLRISGKIDNFFDQMIVLIQEFLKEKGIPYDNSQLLELIQYQRMRIPSFKSPTVTKCIFKFNFPEYFEHCLNRNPISLRSEDQSMQVFPKDYAGEKVRYAREVILWGRKSDAILMEAKWAKI